MNGWRLHPVQEKKSGVLYFSGPLLRLTGKADHELDSNRRPERGTTMQTTENFQARLARLTSHFAGTVPDRVTAIADTLMLCRLDTLAAAPLLERQFHTLAGTAGTYGFSAIAAVAAEGEEICSTIADGSFDENLDHLHFLVDQLRVAAGQCDAPPDRYRSILNSDSGNAPEHPIV